MIEQNSVVWLGPGDVAPPWPVDPHAPRGQPEPAVVGLTIDPAAMAGILRQAARGVRRRELGDDSTARVLFELWGSEDDLVALLLHGHLAEEGRAQR